MRAYGAIRLRNAEVLFISPDGVWKTREFLKSASVFLTDRAMQRYFKDNPKLLEDLLSGKKVELGKPYGPPFPFLINGRDVAGRYGLLFMWTGINQPKPSTFIVDRQGIVRFAKVGKDSTDRSKVSDILRVLDELANAS